MFKYKIYTIIIGFIVIISVFYSCKKEEDEDIPKVTFEYPNENSSYVVGDTIAVKVVIESNSPIKTVAFSLVDEDLNPVISNYVYPLEVISGRAVLYSFPIDNMRLESGKYQISCVVTNQKETKHKYLDVMVSALDRVLKDIAVVTKSGSHIKVWSIGANMEKTPDLLFDIISDYSGSDYLPLNERFALSGSVLGDVNVWNYFTQDTLQVIKVQANPPFPYFSSISSISDYMAVGYYSGSVSLYNSYGDKKVDIISKNSYFPNLIKDVGKSFFIEEVQKGGSNRIISVYNKQSNSYYSAFDVNGNLVSAFQYEDNDVMIFFNVGSQGNIEKYIYKDNATTEPVSYNGGKIISVDQVDSKNYLFTTDDALLWYQYQISSVTSVISNRSFDHLSYDNISKMIFVSENLSIRRISFPDGQYFGSVSLGEEIVDIHLIYNY